MRPSFSTWVVLHSTQVARLATPQAIDRKAQQAVLLAPGHLRSHPSKLTNSTAGSGTSRLLRSRCPTASYAGKSCPCLNHRLQRCWLWDLARWRGDIETAFIESKTVVSGSAGLRPVVAGPGHAAISRNADRFSGRSS